jgi:uncharacterized protein YdaU (DUF1376 family)
MSQNYPWLKMPHRDYMISASYMTLKPVERLAFLELAMYAHTQPNNSLPNDDKFLAAFARVSVKQWLKIKANVFTEWSLVDGFWMLPSWFVVESAPVNQQKEEKQQPPKKAKSNAERQADYKARQKGNGNSNAQVTDGNATGNEEVTIGNGQGNESNVTGNADFVTFGGIKGGDLDLNLEQDLDINQYINSNSNSKTREAEKKSSRFFDDELRPNIRALNSKLGADLVTEKFIEDNLFEFNSHYETRQLTDNQRLAKWVSWFKREQAKQQAQLIQRPSKIQPPKNQKPVFGNVNDAFPINENDRPLTEAEKAAIAKMLEEDEHVVF